MPLISDLLIKKEPNKRFKKTPYRPWDNEASSSSPQETVEDSGMELLSSDNKAFDADEKTTGPAKSSSVVNSTAILLSSPEIHQFSDQSLEKEFRGLFGAQKIILQHLLSLAEERIDEYVITKSISMDEFTLACQLPPNTIKTMLQKLKHKNLLLKHENKPGRGGYARYRILKSVYDFFVEKYFPNQA